MAKVTMDFRDLDEYELPNSSRPPSDAYEPE
jgi:hypothetical protein